VLRCSCPSSITIPAGFQAHGINSDKSDLHFLRNQSIKHLGDACYLSFRFSEVKCAEVLLSPVFKAVLDAVGLSSTIYSPVFLLG
jgi:hypothetical protein